MLLFLATFLAASGYAHDVEKNVNIHNLNADFKTSSVPLKDELYHSSDDNYIRYSPFYHDETTPSTPVTDQLVKEIIIEDINKNVILFFMLFFLPTKKHNQVLFILFCKC